MSTYLPRVGDLIIRAEDRHHWVNLRAAPLGVEEAIAQGQAMLAASEAAADREITRLNARIVALNAEVLDRMDQWHRDSLARDELARQQAAEIARLRAALATEETDR